MTGPTSYEKYLDERRNRSICVYYNMLLVVVHDATMTDIISKNCVTKYYT